MAASEIRTKLDAAAAFTKMRALPRALPTPKKVTTRPKLLTTKRCARNSQGKRTIGKRRVIVCCPPGRFRPRARRRKCLVTRRRLVKAH